MPTFVARIRWVWVLVAWTIFLWLSRLRNVVGNEDLTSSGRAIRLGVVVIFVGLAVVVAGFQLRARVRQRWPQILSAFLIWTVGYWLIRGVGILINGEYSAGFKMVHTVLMLVSLTLSALTARQAGLGR